VNEGSEVKYQGVKIGKVIRIDVDPQDLSSILLYIKIKKGFPIKEDMWARLQYMGITGMRFVEISGGKNDSKSVPPGGQITFGKGLGEKAEDIVVNVDSVVDALNKLLNPENREKLSQFIGHLEKSTRVVANILEKKEIQLKNSVENMDQALSQIKEISINLNKVTLHLSEMSANLQFERLAESSQKAIDAIGQRFSSQELGQTFKSIDSFIETAVTSIRKIENQFFGLEGELNKTLVALRESMQNISRFSRDLREDPTILIRKTPAKRRKK
jgi:phospholipid/cholesterol/gamma-HCH transport system substrate-binding protein